VKLNEVRKKYYDCTQKTSEIVRYLGLAGIGVIWMFRAQGAEKIALPPELIVPTTLLIAGLALDLLQYVSGSIIWGAYNRSLERLGTKEEEEFKCPRKRNWPGLFFYWGKIISILTAYFFLLKFLAGKISS